MNTRTAPINQMVKPGTGKAISVATKAIAITDEDIILGEMKVYEQNKAEYLAKYEGNYIAMLHGKVLDSDTDLSNLATRVYEKFGYQAIFMTFVTKNEKKYKISSPKFN